MSADRPRLPPVAQQALDAWLSEHDRTVPGLVDGLYLVGSLALDDWLPTSDIDVVVVTSRRPDRSDVEALHRLDLPTGVDIDGPYVMADDLRVEPTPIEVPWTLGGERHHDADCFELNSVTWATLGRHGRAVRGPDIADLHVHDDPDALRSFVRLNTDTYWRGVMGMIVQALADADRHEFRAETTSWCVLGPARMLYTVETGAIASKSQAGRWLSRRVPEHADLIETALAIRRASDPAPNGRHTAEMTVAYLDDVITRTLA